MIRLLKELRAGRQPAAASRDTDADWRKIGADEPYFGVLTHSRFLRSNLDEVAKAEFFQTGVDDVASHLQRLNSRFGPFNPRSALDFGCGVGRLTRALASQTGDATGVDISDGMLREASLGATPGARFQRELPDRSFDWIVSIIVFQHIPPLRGYALLRQLLARLAPGGCVTLQFALYRDARHHGTAGGRIDMSSGAPLPSEKALKALPLGEMVMYDYDLSILAAVLFEAGVEELSLLHTDHGGFHGAFVYGRKSG